MANVILAEIQMLPNDARDFAEALKFGDEELRPTQRHVLHQIAKKLESEALSADANPILLELKMTFCEASTVADLLAGGGPSRNQDIARLGQFIRAELGDRWNNAKAA